jgi:hypothetical protein
VKSKHFCTKIKMRGRCLGLCAVWPSLNNFLEDVHCRLEELQVSGAAHMADAKDLQEASRQVRLSMHREVA